MQIGGIERIRLGAFPTPLQELENLSAQLGGPRLFVKRDDLSGLAVGGNKLRKLEYAFAEARSLGATVIITIGGPQSNHVALTTAAANRLGLRTVLVLRGERPERPSGNLLLDGILGPSEIHFVGADGYPSKFKIDRIADKAAADLAERLRAEGEVPYVIPNGCRAIHGAYGYAGCVLEIVSQLRELGLAPTKLLTAIGTSSTYIGLVLGAHLCTHGEADAIGVSVVDTDPADIARRVADQLDEACETLSIDPPVPHDAIHVLGDYVGDDYGVPTDAMRAAVLRVARCEGIVLDPVYTGKAISGLIDLVEKGRLGADDIVVFLHTGGVGGLFADAQIGTFAGEVDIAIAGSDAGASVSEADRR